MTSTSPSTNPKIEVLDQSGKDVTGKFNIRIKDGVAYVYAKTVDTWIPKKGVTVKGDPQPKDLAKYSTNGKHDPLNDPAIDQNLLGQTYRVVMPYKVVKVKDGYTVRNKAIQSPTTRPWRPTRCPTRSSPSTRPRT